MKIAFGIEIFYPETNGVITATINLANNLIKLGHEVYFFVTKNKGFDEDLIEDGIHIVRIKNIPSGLYKGLKIIPVWGWHLMPKLAKYKIDIVHNTTPWLVGRALNHGARRLHIPSLATHHTLLDAPSNIEYALKSKRISSIAQDAAWKVVFDPFYELTWMATAPSENTCAQIRSKIPTMDTRFISNGIDVSKYKIDEPICPIPEAIKPEWLGRNTFIYVGRLGIEKSLDVTVKAFIKLWKEHPEAQLIVIGRGPADEELKKIVAAEKAEKAVHFTGLIPNDQIIGSKILEKNCAFVTASITENQAMTVIESLCSGLPTITADVPNMTCLVSPDMGWYFEPKNIDDFALKMEYALTHPEERDQKAIEAKKGTARFDGMEVAKQFEALYKELLEWKDKGFYVPGGEKRAKKYLKKIRKYQDK